jgi:excisionase family DNA binding protein
MEEMGSLDSFADFEMLKVAEAANCLRVSPDLVYELVHQRQLPAVRLGRKIRLPAFGLKQWIRQQAGLPMPEPEGLCSPRQKH